MFQLFASQFNLLSNRWVTFLEKSTCWVSIDQLWGTTLINSGVESWSTVEQQVDLNQHVDQWLINFGITSWSTLGDKVDQLLINKLINTCWSTVTQHVDFRIKVSQLLLNKFNFETINWKELINCWSTSWSTNVDQLLLNMLIFREKLLNCYSTSWIVRRRVEKSYSTIDQHVDSA